MSSQIVLPDDFLAVVRSGVLNLVDGIRLSDIRWMTPVQIASFDRPPFLSDRLIPFALTAGRSRYGWWRESESCTCKFVVFSPRDCDEALIYAPDFSAFLYRSILEDLVDCWGGWLDDDSRVDAIVEMARRNVALASPFLPVAWARTLGEVVSRTPRWSATGSMTWIDSAEARDLILKHFGDFAIDTSIIQHHEQVEMAALVGHWAVGVNVGRIVQRWAMVVGSRRVVLDAPVAVYNLEVAGAHTYFVEDGLGRQTPLWVHNNCEWRLHHVWPQYLGGAAKQKLQRLPRSLHDAYHAGLDKILPRQVRGGAAEYYRSLSPSQQAVNFQKFMEYTKAFDAKHGTALWKAIVDEATRI